MKTQPLGEQSFQSLVEFVRSSFVDYKRELWEEPAQGWAYSYKILPPNGRGGFLRRLLVGSGETKLAWDSVSLIAQELLRAGETLPAELAGWVADVLEGKRPRPTMGPQTTSGRDRQIYLAVAHVAERFGLNPTRRRKQMLGAALPICCAKGGSACDVVGAAFQINYKTTEKAWFERDPIIASHRKHEKN